MTSPDEIAVPVSLIETPHDEVLVLLGQVRADLEARGYGREDIATALVSTGAAALSDLRGDREAGRELYLLAMILGRQADSDDAQPKH